VKIKVIEITHSRKVGSRPGEWSPGYGRDTEEAWSHVGGGSDEDFSSAEMREVLISDEPVPEDNLSAYAADSVCRYSIDEDPEVPSSAKEHMRSLIAKRLFATAVRYCFDAVWDRGFELDLPPDQRKYLP